MKAILLCLFTAISFTGSSQNYNIGHKEITWVDYSRNKRSVKVEVYYPGTSSGNNVPVINNEKQFPLVVFAHGLQLTYKSYTWLKDSLVPKGFFLVFLRTEEFLIPDQTNFAKDIAFVVDKFDNDKNNSSQWFYNKLSGRYVASGHSVGGGCSLLSVQYNKKINAVFNFAAAETNPSAITASNNINIPTLLFAGGKDCICPPVINQLPMYNNIQPVCKTFVEITQAQHCHWANNDGICTVGQLVCLLGSLPKPTINKTFSLLLPWLNSAVNNEKKQTLRFENLLASTNGITYKQQCGGMTNPVANAQQQQLKLYPSVVHRGMMVNVDLSSIQNKLLLQVSDQNGRIVLSDNITVKSSEKISTSNFTTGIYFVAIKTNDKEIKGSFIIE